MKASPKPKILVITAHADEAQFSCCQQSVAEQRGCDVEHLVLRGYGFVDSQKAVYEASVDAIGRFDMTLKLDADMILLSHDFLSKTYVWLYRKRENLSRITLPVDDFFTKTKILGVHSWLTDATPLGITVSEPQPDKWISNIPGRNLWLSGSVVSHGHEPSIGQALRFGLNRALKARDGGRYHPHWRELYSLEKAHRKAENATRRAYALLGAAIAFDIVGDMRIDWENNCVNDRLFQEVVSWASQLEPKELACLVPKSVENVWGWYRKIHGSRVGILRHQLRGVANYLIREMRTFRDGFLIDHGF